jgi:hypothetical protein
MERETGLVALTGEQAMVVWRRSRPRSKRLRRPRPSAWECDGGRETALVFALGVE